MSDHPYDCRCEDCVSYAPDLGSTQKVIDWRLQSFLEMGFAVKTAEGLARARGTVDVYETRRLLARGCSVELASRILRPV